MALGVGVGEVGEHEARSVGAVDDGDDQRHGARNAQDATMMTVSARRAA